MLQYFDIATTDPAYNLAAEQFVFEELPKDRDYFMLWQNDRSVIIGRYQNTLAEVNLPYLEKNNVRVVRRLSGGGAVYHDFGNLNYTFITDAQAGETLNLRLFCEPVVRTLSAFGVKAEISGRNDISVAGKKFSGNAQIIRHGRVLHHGTILFDSDLDAVGCALQVDPEKIEAKGIRSVRSRVTNLRPFLGTDVTLPIFRGALLQEVLRVQAGEKRVFTSQEEKTIRAIKTQRYDTWDWNFGASPECTIRKSQRFEGVGRIEAYITLEHSRICSVTFRGDYFGSRDTEELSSLLVGRKLEHKDLTNALSGQSVSDFFIGLQTQELINLFLA